MAKDCPKCGVSSSDEAQRCDCGYNYAIGMLRRETNEVDRGFGRIEGGQTYKFGWFVGRASMAKVNAPRAGRLASPPKSLGLTIPQTLLLRADQVIV
jgi:hypothetical protein